MIKIYDFLLEKIEFIIGVGIGLLFALMVSITLDTKKEYKYDLNNDGAVDIKDMLIVQQYILDNEGCECK